MTDQPTGKFRIAGLSLTPEAKPGANPLASPQILAAYEQSYEYWRRQALNALFTARLDDSEFDTAAWETKLKQAGEAVANLSVTFDAIVALRYALSQKGESS